MKELLKEVLQCKLCASHLPNQPKPVVTTSISSRIIIVGQAPGSIVHRTGVAWNDKSGDNLRNWMGLNREEFYDTKKIALIPMGFCYPGRGKSGDLPPRKECAPLWHSPLFNSIKNVQLVLLVGKYAQDYYLKEQIKSTLTATVKNFKEYLPQYFVLPHPSPRNNIWQAKNEWFKREVIPQLKLEVSTILK